MVSWSCLVCCEGFSPWMRVCTAPPEGRGAVKALPPFRGRMLEQPHRLSVTSVKSVRVWERFCISFLFFIFSSVAGGFVALAFDNWGESEIVRRWAAQKDEY